MPPPSLLRANVRSKLPMGQEAIIRVDDDGRFRRKKSEFRSTVEAGDDARFPARAGRYHLYVAWACPWAHRTLLTRKLYSLDDAISVSVVHWLMDDRGAWHFKPQEGYVDDVLGAADMEGVYREADPDWPGIGTVPVLWDKEQGTIVNNESREIVRMLSVGFRGLHGNDLDLLPEGHKDAIDAMIDANYETVNNGVYKAGFARSQGAYDEAIDVLFGRLAELDDHLADRTYLVGDTLTEADVCLFPTLLRFDPVYQFHFKCTRRRIRDHPNLWRYTTHILDLPRVRSTINMVDTRRHYFGSHAGINPSRIVPAAPEIPEFGL